MAEWIDSENEWAWIQQDDTKINKKLPTMTDIQDKDIGNHTLLQQKGHKD